MKDEGWRGGRKGLQKCELNGLIMRHELAEGNKSRARQMSKCRVSKRQTPRHFPIAIATNRVPQSFPANVLARNPDSPAHQSVRSFSFLEAGIIDEADI